MKSGERSTLPLTPALREPWTGSMNTWTISNKTERWSKVKYILFVVEIVRSHEIWNFSSLWTHGRTVEIGADCRVHQIPGYWLGFRLDQPSFPALLGQRLGARILWDGYSTDSAISWPPQVSLFSVEVDQELNPPPAPPPPPIKESSDLYLLKIIFVSCFLEWEVVFSSVFQPTWGSSYFFSLYATINLSENPKTLGLTLYGHLSGCQICIRITPISSVVCGSGMRSWL